MDAVMSVSMDGPRLHWLESTGYLQRRIVYLDLRYWIGMSEQVDDAHIALRELLREHVRDGRVICAISPSLILEIEKRPQSPKRDAYFALIDEFCLGLAIRPAPLMFKDEFYAALVGGRISRSLAFATIWHAYADMSLELPAGMWPQERLAEFAQLLYPAMAQMPIQEMTSQGKQRADGTEHAHRLHNAWVELCERERQARSTGVSTMAALLEAEFASAVQSYSMQIAEVVLRLPQVNSDALHALDGLPETRMRALLNSCPTFVSQYRLIAALRSNRRQLKPNDLWDISHIGTALPYVDCLGCDGGMRHICELVLPHLPSHASPELVASGAQRIVDWLAKLC